MPFVLPGEQVEASAVESRSGFARAKLDKVLTPSPERIEPGVLTSGAAADATISTSTTTRNCATRPRSCARRCAAPPSSNSRRKSRFIPREPWNYRNRTRMQVRHTPEFALGYYRHNSHDVLPVETCPISSPLINQAIAAVWKLGRDGAVPESVHGLQFFANHDDTRLLVEAYVKPGDNPAQELSALRRGTAQRCRSWLGVVVFATSALEDESRQRAPLTSILPKLATGHRRRFADVPRCRTRLPGQRRLVLPDQPLPDRQARANRGRQQNGRAALDLYAGAGLFTAASGAQFRHRCWRSSPRPIPSPICATMFPPNVKCIRATTENFSRRTRRQTCARSGRRRSAARRTGREDGHSSVSHDRLRM